MQIVITFYCIWISASHDQTTSQIGTGMLIASVLAYIWQTRRNHLE
jgi:hypothetical protein